MCGCPSEHSSTISSNSDSSQFPSPISTLSVLCSAGPSICYSLPLCRDCCPDSCNSPSSITRQATPRSRSTQHPAGLAAAKAVWKHLPLSTVAGRCSQVRIHHQVPIFWLVALGHRLEPWFAAPFHPAVLSLRLPKLVDLTSQPMPAKPPLGQLSLLRGSNAHLDPQANINKYRSDLLNCRPHTVFPAPTPLASARRPAALASSSTTEYMLLLGYP